MLPGIPMRMRVRLGSAATASPLRRVMKVDVSALIHRGAHGRLLDSRAYRENCAQHQVHTGGKRGSRAEERAFTSRAAQVSEPRAALGLSVR